MTIQTHFCAYSVIIRPVQFQTMSSHTNYFFSKSFDIILQEFSFDYYHISQSWLLILQKKVPEKRKQHTMSLQRRLYPMHPSCLQDNRSFTIFVEPSGMHFLFPFFFLGAYKPLAHGPIIGCVLAIWIGFLTIWVNMSYPFVHEFLTQW